MDDDGLINANAYVDICEFNYNTYKNTTQIIVNRSDILDSFNDKVDAAYIAEQVLTYAHRKCVALSTVVHHEMLIQNL
jgi:hypothetical protein